MLSLFLLILPAQAQELWVAPYLQHATPTSIWVLWQTSEGDESIVEWGTTTALGQSTEGSLLTGVLAPDVHEVELTGLLPDTTYWYRARTGSLTTDTYSFRTPAEQGSEGPSTFVVVSDMQRSSAHPNVWGEIVTEGVFPFVEARRGPVVDHLDGVLIPGDLVDDGWDADDWIDTYFTPAAPLLASVPSYPVPGNHEANSPSYFAYTHTPPGSSGIWSEHWWQTDHSNVRLIGLDSNVGYRNQTQLDFLQDALDDACDDTAIDFVFAQLHHPHLSELWTPGELDYTGDVIALLEAFSTTCGKPSIHFFGHTHGYSRGQSRDHQHLWVNAATAGGAIDGWGEFPQYDYEEFTVSWDDWGFVLVEVEAGADPSVLLTRVSRGDAAQPLDNVVNDEVQLRLFNAPPQTPSGQKPSGTVGAACSTLTASGFADPDGDPQGASQFQISTDCGDFGSPVLDRWIQHENWFFDVDTQAGDDLTDLDFAPLEPDTDYCWRVRYRDRGLVWSDWSTPLPFVTGPDTSTTSDDLVVNGGAEDGELGWTTEVGALESVTDGACNGISPHAGDRYFAVGGICDDHAVGRAYQEIDLTTWATEIDAGDALVAYGAWMSNYSGSDVPSMYVTLYDDTGALLETSPVLAQRGDSWTAFSTRHPIPAGARSARVVLEGERNAGSDNDSYIDDVWMRVSTGYDTDCGVAATPPDPVDTDPPEDTDITVDTDVPVDTDPPPGEDTDPSPGEDTDGPQDPKTGCGCQASASPVGWLWLVGLLGWRRRSA